MMIRSPKIIVGNKCNNNCLFCNHHDITKKDQSFKCIRERLLEYRKEYESIALSGGEPTIRPDFFDLLSITKELKYAEVGIETNGRMFSSIEFCKRSIFLGVNNFIISLNGYCREQHNYLTSSESFDETVKGIINLKKLSAYVCIYVHVQKSNYFNLPRISELILRLGADEMVFSVLEPINSEKEDYISTMPRFSMLSAKINESLEICKKISRKVKGMPYCHMKMHENLVAKGNNLWHSCHFKDSTLEKNTSEKTKICAECIYIHICKHPSRVYVEYYGDREFSPIRINLGPNTVG